MRTSWFRWCLLLLFAARLAYADAGPAFDLVGPRIQAKVTRGGKSLPIGEVASLAPGDRLWIHPDLPQQEAARYVLVVAFLRGPVNPPPENWFIKAETWNKKVREEGIYATVPNGAEQVLLFLAPATGGDFSTLRNAVRGRPGAFVRAAQDLYQASLDQARLDTYLAAVKKADASDPKAVEAQAKLLARSLNIKADKDCFDKPTDQQAPCLVQNPSALVLDDGRSATMVQALTSGPAANMLSQMSYTEQAGSGYYSVYVGTVMDMARVLDSFRTAEYQYLPALAMPEGDTLELKLNNPPSFHKPQSVLVVGLPAIAATAADQNAGLPAMHAVDPTETLCAQKTPLVLPVDGAPYVFATSYAHDFVLRVRNKAGQDVDVPATADPALGGFVVDAKTLGAEKLDPSETGTLRGYWGFAPFEGPSFELVAAHSQQWTLNSADQHALVVGRADTVHLDSTETACVEGITIKDAGGTNLAVTWKAVKPNEVQVDLPLKDANAGAVNLLVKQAGLEKPDEVSLHAYSEAGHLDSFTLYSGDHQGTLKGTRLDEVASMTVNRIVFSPAAALTHTGSEDSLVLTAPESASSSFHENDQVVAKVTLKDGRVLDLNASVQAPRPEVKLMNRSIHFNGPASTVQLGSQDELPVSAKLTFFIQAVTPAAFSRDQSIEVASDDNSFHTVLRVGKGDIVLQDAKTALVTLDPANAFGGSAFGPLRFRPISGEGVAGDWQPLATLVRVPQLEQLQCASGASLCTLAGSGLFLLEEAGADPQMANAVSVPEGFGDATLNVPRPAGPLYFKLRDDPAVVNTAVLPVVAPPGQAAAPAASRAPTAVRAQAAPASPPAGAPNPSSQTVPATAGNPPSPSANPAVTQTAPSGAAPPGC